VAGAAVADVTLRPQLLYHQQTNQWIITLALAFVLHASLGNHAILAPAFARAHKRRNARQFRLNSVKVKLRSTIIYLLSQQI
jgi:hypothetical protein